MEGTTTTTKDSNNGTFAKPTLISASVPRFSLSDEQREMEDVSPSEKHAIAIDLHGLHSVPWRHTRTAQGQQQQQQQTCAQSLPASEMEQFAQVLEQIPLEEKSDYEMAQVICPDICNTESSPVRFLQSEDHNPELAARKMVKYWKMRHHFFKAKAFMAMTLAGAMADDVNTLCEVPNFFRILGYDERGRTVFCGNLEGGLNLNHYDPIQIVRFITFLSLWMPCLALPCLFAAFRTFTFAMVRSSIFVSLPFILSYIRRSVLSGMWLTWPFKTKQRCEMVSWAWRFVETSRPIIFIDKGTE